MGLGSSCRRRQPASDLVLHSLPIPQTDLSLFTVVTAVGSLAQSVVALGQKECLVESSFAGSARNCIFNFALGAGTENCTRPQRRDQRSLARVRPAGELFHCKRTGYRVEEGSAWLPRSPFFGVLFLVLSSVSVRPCLSCSAGNQA